MVDRNDARRWISASALSFLLATWGVAISASPSQSSQNASGTTNSKNELGMEFVVVSPGEFQMGCSEGAKPNECSRDEKPRHRVQITKAFEIGKTEVTGKQWQAVMGSDPSAFKGQDLPWGKAPFPRGREFFKRLHA